MKKLLIYFTFIISFFGCQNKAQDVNDIPPAENSMGNNSKDSLELLTLIRHVMLWQESKEGIETLPMEINDSNICIGMDPKIQKENIKKLEASNFFTKNFIENYQKIINKLDELIKTKEIKPFDLGDGIPPFNFSSDANAWCDCQDNLGWNQIEIKDLKFAQNTCDFIWYWKEWKEFSYRVKAKKVDGVWKIDELQGFDYKRATTLQT